MTPIWAFYLAALASNVGTGLVLSLETLYLWRNSLRGADTLPK